MKHESIRVEQDVLASQGRMPEAWLRPVENETQRVLRRALESFGPNGENWLCGRDNPVGLRYVIGNKSCAMGALKIAYKGSAFEGNDKNPAANALKRAISSDYKFVHEYNDAPTTTFADIRAMFHRAIELAGSVSLASTPAVVG